MRTDGELLTWGEGLVFVLSVWHTMNHSICCRAEHYETATDTSMIPVTCAYDEAYYMLLLKQSVVKIGGVAIAMEICRVRLTPPGSIDHKTTCCSFDTIPRKECITRKGRWKCLWWLCMYIRHDIKQRSQQSSPSGIFDTYDMLYLWRSVYIMIYERGARGWSSECYWSIYIR